MNKLLFVSFIFLFSCSQQKKDTSTFTTIHDTMVLLDTVVKREPPEAPVNVPATEIIIPGQKIGMISIEEKGDAVHAQLGTPDFGDAAMQKSISGWYSKSDSAIQTKIYFENDMSGANTGPHVKQIRVNSTFFKTENRITTGSSLQDIEKYYPNLKKALSFRSTRNQETIKVMDDQAEGIAFEIDSHNICKGITVHVPGKGLFGYLQFYE